MDLGGTWRVVEANDELRRVFPEPDLDDSTWATMEVPGHWRSHPEFGESDGPVLYRNRFETPARPEETAGTDRRAWLRLDGLFYQGDVWLDRSYLGDTEGYFAPHSFEITQALRERAEHVLAIEVTCARPTDLTAKRNLTGIFQHWDCIDRDWNPGGIWRPVRLEETGPVRIAAMRVLCPEATAERAVLEIRVVLDAAQAGVVSLVTEVRPAAKPADPAAPVDPADPAKPAAPADPADPAAPAAPATAAERRTEHPLAAGRNRVTWRLAVEQPSLWWPHALGDQPLYDVRVDVLTGPGPAPGHGPGPGPGPGPRPGPRPSSDHRTVRTGLRQVRMKNFIATVNGERIYLKGVNHGPTRRALGEATAAEIEADVTLARQAGLDLMRIHGHISHPELYDAADRHGMLLWQDLPLQWGYAGVRRQAVRQAREAVDLLGHHPSIAVWCGHNEPVAVAVDNGPGGRVPATTRARFLAGQILPTRNKTALDRSIRRTLEKSDSSRPVVAHSGILPHPAWGTDSHLYFGWYHGEERDFPAALARFPIVARFVSEFGAQAVPATAGFCEPQQWPDLDWAHLARAHSLQKASFDRYVPPASYPTFEAWRDATQAYQATIIRHHIETLRRLKYRPTGGFCMFMLADSQPAVTWSVLDYERVPKAGFEALAAACAPVIVVADRLATRYTPGDAVTLDLHVVSDLRTRLEGARLKAALRWPGGRRDWWFGGDIDADSCLRIGTLRTELDSAPEATGLVTLELDLDWPGGKAHNRYDSVLGLEPGAIPTRPGVGD